uniref:Uncharacterized protein n=1 Tax=viral metagenome TaxID=1070528 RepID=A0A6C0E7Y8_9ZZZZ
MSIINFLDKQYTSLSDFIKYINNEIHLGNNLNIQDGRGHTMSSKLIKYHANLFDFRTHEDDNICLETLKKLIDSGANIHIKDNINRTILMRASGDSNAVNPLIIKLLIDYGADVNMQDKYGKTALMNACRNPGYVKYLDTKNAIEIIKLLIVSGADLDLRDNNGYTALMLASQYSNIDSSIDVVKLLIDYGADLDARNNDNFTALMLVSKDSYYYSSCKTLKLLIDSGANLDACDNDNLTALMYAVRYSKLSSSIDTVKILIESGANLNLQKHDGLTALMIASGCSKSGSSTETVKLLIDSGANLHITDIYNDTFLSYLVRFSDSLDIIKEVIKMDMDITINNVTKIPIEKMNNPKYKAYNGNTLLHWCMIGIKENTSNYEILEYLESLDIDKTLKNGEGKTYLDYLIVSYYVSTKCEICHIDENIVMAILNCSCNCGRQCVNCAYRLTKCCYCRTEFDGFKIIRIV